MKVKTLLLIVIIITTVPSVIVHLAQQNNIDRLRESYEDTIYILDETMDTMLENLTITHREKEELQNNFNNLTFEIGIVTGLKNTFQNMYNETETKYDEIDHLYNNLISLSDRYHLHDPTYEEVLDFVEYDTTDQNVYSAVSIGYICAHFARDFNNNAEDEGIKCGIVYFYANYYNDYYEDYIDFGHAISCFNTIDEGVIYVDPQDDTLYDSINEIEEDWISLGYTDFWIYDYVISW